MPAHHVAPPPADRAWAFFLDIDGTLVDLVASPNEVYVTSGTREVIHALFAASGGAVALVSGRSILDIDRLFPDALLHVAGQHGLERRDALGTRWATGPDGAGLDSARARLAAFVVQEPALLLEDKHGSLALHYRAAPHLEQAVLATVTTALAELGKEYQMQRGKYVVEIRPADADKGAAIEHFLGVHPFRDRVPVFVGDDNTDEAGFAVVNGKGGHSVKVGEGTSIARWRLRDTAAVMRWLAGACAGGAHMAEPPALASRAYNNRT